MVIHSFISVIFHSKGSFLIATMLSDLSGQPPVFNRPWSKTKRELKTARDRVQKWLIIAEILGPRYDFQFLERVKFQKHCSLCFSTCNLIVTFIKMSLPSNQSLSNLTPQFVMPEQLKEFKINLMTFSVIFEPPQRSLCNHVKHKNPLAS